MSGFEVSQGRLREHLLSRETCRAIHHAFSRPGLVNLISKDGNLVLLKFTKWFTIQTSDYGVIVDLLIYFS